MSVLLAGIVGTMIGTFVGVLLTSICTLCSSAENEDDFWDDRGKDK